MRSPFAVLPLHLEDLIVGESQFDQSSSSRLSKAGGFQENRLRDLGSGRERDRRCCTLLPRSPVFERAGELLPLLSSVAKGTRGRFAADARMVSWSPSSILLSLAAMSLVLFEVPDTPSSPTVACRKSSTNVQRPCRKSLAICFMPEGG